MYIYTTLGEFDLTTVGLPGGLEPLLRSKSVNIICPLW